MSGVLVKVEQVVKRFGPVIAVDSVSLEISRGEVYSLVGANGAGKSTLIRMIAGITRPDSGRVFISGEDLGSGAPGPRKHLGYLPEELVLYERLTGIEFLELVSGLRGTGRDLIQQEIEFFALEAVAGKWIGGYSLGMRKKLGLAAAMLGSPDLMVLDEPLNGLDVEMMRKLRFRIESERRTGRAFLVSSHVMDFVERISDRAGVMSAGKLVCEGPIPSLREMAGMADENFEDVFFRLIGKGLTEYTG